MAYHMNTQVSSSQTEKQLAETFDKWGVRDYQVDYNVMRSRHRSRGLTQQERAVTVRWVPRGSQRPVVLSIDRHDTPQDNVRVLYLAIEALRMNDVRGIGEAIQSAYLQLGAGSGESWWTLLGFPGPNVTLEEVDTQFRALAKEAHPDRGGSDEAMAKLNRAREEAYRALGIGVSA